MRGTAWAILLVGVLLGGCLASSQGPEAAPTVSSSSTAARPGSPLQIPFAPVALTQVSTGSEPMILADKAGQFLWVGDTSGGYLSRDNGTHWNHMGNYAGGSNFAFVDGWDLAQDDAGNLYAAVLRDNRVDVTRSSDGGVSWNQVGYAAGVSGSADRPWIAAKGDGEVALFYFDAPTVLLGFTEHCARSTDGGRTFLDRDPTAVSPGQGGSAFYDSQGRLYFASDTGSLMRFDSTCLAGANGISMVSSANFNNMLQGTADGTDLYMAAATDGSKTVTLAGSQDGGAVKRLVVSPPDLHSNTYAAVAAHGGQVAVAWYGSTSGGDPSATSFAGDFDAYLAVVDHFWTTPKVTQYKLTATPNHHGQICMGGATCDLAGGSTRGLLDYFKVAYDIWGGIHVAFVDDAAGSAHVLHSHVPPKQAAIEPPTGPKSPIALFTVRITDRSASADASLSKSPTGSELTFAWDWGDGTTATGVKAHHDFAALGTYDIQLTATDAEGLKGTHATRVAVDGSSAGPPKASWEIDPQEVVVGDVVTFHDTSVAVGDAHVIESNWDFGDGSRGIGATAQHVYDAEGTYAVRLTVVDNHKSSDTLAKDVVVVTAGNATQSETTAPTSRGSGLGDVWVFAAAGCLAIAAIVRRRD